MIKILIVEDDPMVAELNKKFVNTIPGFRVELIANSVEQAKCILKKHSVDLILLDIYMPGANGFELLRDIRESDKNIDVILVTAASDMGTVQDAVRFGSVDYLIKPFLFERLKNSLLSYRAKREFVQNQEVVSQEELDTRIFSRDTIFKPRTLPKGLTHATLKIILKEIRKMKSTPFGSNDLANNTGMSCVSVRKYLKFLEEIEIIESENFYGSVGRPSTNYLYKKENEYKLSEYTL